MRPGLSRGGALVALPVLVLACATSSTNPPAGGGSAAAPGGFQRWVAPFPVLDEHGREYAHPFLGGFVAPRPGFVDIDGDGDLDLFVQELNDELRFFENVGSAAAPRYEWRTDKYQDLDIGEWYRFVDVDADGMVDLLSEEATSYIRYWRNEGTAAQARFVRTDSLRDSSGEPIFMDRQNIPALVDVDCDARLDLFVGRVEGTVARYEAERPGSERFVFLTEMWEGIEIIGTVLPGPGGGGETPSARHGANALAFGDFDGDGDPDLLWGDFFEAGVLLLDNVGRTCSTPSFQVEPVGLPYADSVHTSGYNAPVPVDLNQDGQLDFVMGVLGGAYNPIRTASDNFYHWERTAPDRLELRTRRFLAGIDVGSESVPTVVDLDGDGLLDLVVGSKIDPRTPDTGLLFFFRNEGAPRAPRLRLADTLRVATAFNLAPAFADLDGDGRLDLVLGSWSGDVHYFRGEGTTGIPRFTPDASVSFRLPRGSNATPALGDLDGDGDLDLLVGQSNGAVAYYRNDGTPQAPRFSLVEERLGEITAGRRSAPALVDMDGDGLADLVLGGESGGATLHRNLGGGPLPSFAPGEPLGVPLPPMSSPALADLDGDGALDLLSGSVSGGVVFWRGTRR